MLAAEVEEHHGATHIQQAADAKGDIDQRQYEAHCIGQDLAPKQVKRAELVTAAGPKLPIKSRLPQI